MSKKQVESGKSSERHAPNPIQLQKFLGGLDYPAGKQDIIDKAKKHGAGENAMDVLGKIPDQEYSSPVAISRELGKLH